MNSFVGAPHPLFSTIGRVGMSHVCGHRRPAAGALQLGRPGRSGPARADWRSSPPVVMHGFVRASGGLLPRRSEPVDDRLHGHRYAPRADDRETNRTQIENDSPVHDHHSFDPMRLRIVKPKDVPYRQIPGSNLVDRHHPKLRRLDTTGRGWSPRLHPTEQRRGIRLIRRTACLARTEQIGPHVGGSSPSGNHPKRGHVGAVGD
jgi:hypothetical protein